MAVHIAFNDRKITLKGGLAIEYAKGDLTRRTEGVTYLLGQVHQRGDLVSLNEAGREVYGYASDRGQTPEW